MEVPGTSIKDVMNQLPAVTHRPRLNRNGERSCSLCN